MSTRTSRKKTTKAAALIAAAAFTLAGCGANQSVLQSGKPDANASTKPAAETKPSFESDIEAMRTAGFAFIYSLRRKDGGPIDSEDRSVIRTHTTQANRRVSSDDGKAVIVGSNFEIPQQSMAAIYQRFAVENYSPAPAAPVEPLPAQNQNQNANR